MRRWVLAVSVSIFGAVVLLAPGVSGAAGHAAPRENPAAAARWFLHQRTTRGVTAPSAYAQAQQTAVKEASLARSQQKAAPGATSMIWQPLGPAPMIQEPLSFPGSPVQNVDGRNSSIATTGTGAGEKVAIASAGGGVWTSNPNGAATVWSEHTDFLASQAFGAVAYAPSNGQVMYAGTGEDNSGGDVLYGQGILVSSNGGASWVARNPGGALSAQATSALAVDPADSSHLYVATTAGFFSSTDAAVSLGSPTTITYAGAAASSNVSGMAVDPTNFNTVFVAVPGVGIEKSVDGGANFAVLTGGLPAGATFGNTILAISPDGQTLYTLIEGKSGANATGAQLWKTVNGGTSWTHLTNAPNVTNPGFYYGGTGTDQGFYDLGLAIDPLNPSVVYFAGIGMAMSTNGGTTWSSTGCSTATAGCSLGGLGIHPDFHALTFDAAGNLSSATTAASTSCPPPTRRPATSAPPGRPGAATTSCSTPTSDHPVLSRHQPDRQCRPAGDRRPGQRHRGLQRHRLA